MVMSEEIKFPGKDIPDEPKKDTPSEEGPRILDFNDFRRRKSGELDQSRMDGGSFMNLRRLRSEKLFKIWEALAEKPNEVSSEEQKSQLINYQLELNSWTDEKIRSWFLNTDPVKAVEDHSFCFAIIREALKRRIFT